MSISIRYDGTTEALHSFGGTYVVICDHCGEEIAQDGAHNVESAPAGAGEVRPVRFYHFHCSDAAKQQRPESERKTYWSKLVSLTLKT